MDREFVGFVEFFGFLEGFRIFGLFRISTISTISAREFLYILEGFFGLGLEIFRRFFGIFWIEEICRENWKFVGFFGIFRRFRRFQKES